MRERDIDAFWLFLCAGNLDSEFTVSDGDYIHNWKTYPKGSKYLWPTLEPIFKDDFYEHFRKLIPAERNRQELNIGKL